MTPRKLMDYRLPPGQSQFRKRINETYQLQQDPIAEANKLDGDRQSYQNNAGKDWESDYSGLVGIGTIRAAAPAATVAVKRLFIAMALSVVAGGCGPSVGQDVRAYNTCLSRHPNDTVVCEAPRQAYELDPSVVQLRSVASRPAAGYRY